MPPFPTQRRVECRDHLGDDQARRGPLQDPRRDQGANPRGRPADQRGEHEAGHPYQQHPPTADHVAQPPAEDQCRGIGRPVASDDEFERASTRTQRRLDRGKRDIDDEEVDLGQEDRGDQHGEAGPGQASDRPGGIARGSGGGCRTGDEVMAPMVGTVRAGSQQRFILGVAVTGTERKHRIDTADRPGPRGALPPVRRQPRRNSMHLLTGNHCTATAFPARSPGDGAGPAPQGLWRRGGRPCSRVTGVRRPPVGPR